MTPEYIIAGAASFAVVTFLTLWRIAHNEARHSHNQNVKAAEVIDALRKERDMAYSKIEKLETEADQLRPILRNALIRNSKGQLVRADGKPTDPKRIARREREKNRDRK